MVMFMEYIHMASKLIVGLIGIIIVIRLLGKKEMAQVTILDFVYALVLGGVIKDAMYDPAVTIPMMLFVLAVWGLLIYIFEKVTQKAGVLRHVIKGRPVTLISEGKVRHQAMKKMNMEIEELDELLRVEGVFSLQEVNYAMLENSGQLSVLKKNQVSKEYEGLDVPSYTLVSDGEVMHAQLKDIDKGLDWLEEALAGMNKKYSDIYIAEWNSKKGWHIQDYDDNLESFD